MQLSGYHVKDVIGQGGMATVYRAEHILLKQERALKVMSPELTNHPGFKESFIREGQIVATLKHPNIIPIYDIEERDGYYFMAMDYLQGGNLKELLAQSSLPIPRALQILQQIGNALHYAHQEQFIHRDIKPANILFNSVGDAILTDFGISKLQNTDSDLTQHGYGLLGTPRYMSPEQAIGTALDARSDLYSLALVFYELLTGKSAIEADNMAAIIHIHTSEPPPTLPNNIKFLQPVLNKALAAKADERYADIPAFIDAVTAQFADDKTQLITKPATKRAKKSKPKPQTVPKTKRPSLLLRFAILFMLLGGMAGIEWWRTYHPQQWQAFFNTQETQNIPIAEEEPIASLPEKPIQNTKNEINNNEITTENKVTKKLVENKETNKKEKSNNIEEKEISPKKPEEEEVKITDKPSPPKKEKSTATNIVDEQTPRKIKKENISVAVKKPQPEKEKNTSNNKKEPSKEEQGSNQIKSFKIVRVTPYIKLYSDLGSIRIGQIKKGSRVGIIEELQSPDGKWWNKIDFNGKQGYVISSKLEKL